jgi:hypothetical protein
MKSEGGIQHVSFLLAMKKAKEYGCGSRDHCALLIDEMIITNGIVYSVTHSKVFGLSEVAPHGIKSEIYHDFYGMESDGDNNENPTNMSYFTETSKKLEGHTAKGLTQVKNRKLVNRNFISYLPNY